MMTDDPRAIDRLLGIMARLRDPQRGCPWDVEQDFASIAPYTIEEAYEVADAIDRGDLADLRGELGDLLLQVVFHAQMAHEQGAFDFGDVVQSISDKMVRRHPHVFADTAIGSATEQRAAWDRLKAGEREAAGDVSVLAGVEQAVPALTRARKLGRRAAGVGFDWPDVDGVIAKVHEELNELLAAHASQDPDAMEDEMGDLLFAAANLARRLEVDPEEALRRANRKFEQRFRALEAEVLAGGRPWDQHTVADLEAIWDRVKRRARQQSRG
jgi:MazG family protein